VGRDEPDPALMKPSPYLVRSAVGIPDAHPAEYAFAGDSTTGMVAGRLAGVPVIGYANKPGKAELLTQAGADAVTTGLDEITTALRITPRPWPGDDFWGFVRCWSPNLCQSTPAR
jgi:phosphoglycolate phosphatase-like HAD superfamily hydrolase